LDTSWAQSGSWDKQLAQELLTTRDLYKNVCTERLQGALEATMRCGERGERVLYMEEGVVGHGKPGDVQCWMHEGERNKTQICYWL
jgi:hypothetical protein